MKLGLIAGNGRFPFLLLDAARAQGLAVVVAAIREETDAEIDRRAAEDAHITVHWLSLGELSRLIETFHKEGVTKAVMAGQVKHKQIFSSIRPDWRLAKLLLNLRTRSTDMLLGAVAKVLGDEGIELISSTAFLEPLLATEGTLTQRAPDDDERLTHWIGRLGLAALADRPFQNLSGGEQRRTHLARVFAQEPELVLLDEPAGHLDFPAQEALVRLLHELWRESEITIVLVTHDLRHLPPGLSHVVLLREGRIVRQGRPEETLTAEALSETFNRSVEVYQHRGRWTATAEVSND